MEILERIDALRAWRGRQRDAGLRVALVPTMGNLHAGHLALLDTARAHADIIIASIFVNPLQFGHGEDFDRYPRTFEDDVAALSGAGCAAVFAPGEATLYPHGRHITQVCVPDLGNLLCGEDRPGHFDGVTTVVSLLFHLVEPDVAVFGEKDYQQLQIIRRMVRDLHMPVAVHGHPIARDSDGLALSSRNQYLDAAQRERAPALYATLREAAAARRAGERDPAALEARGMAALRTAGFQPVYLRVLDPALGPPQLPGEVVIAAAARLGSTRLIDNIRVVV